MAKVRAKRLRYIVIPDNFSVEGHLSPLATPPDGINFSFSIGRSASVPMSKQLSLYKSCSVSMQVLAPR